MTLDLIIAIVAISVFALCVRWTFALIGIACMFVLVSAVRAETTTTCYQQGSNQVCETRGQDNAVISTSRCYQAGNEVRCESSSSSSGSSSSSTTIVPFNRRPK